MTWLMLVIPVAWAVRVWLARPRVVVSSLQWFPTAKKRHASRRLISLVLMTCAAECALVSAIWHPEGWRLGGKRRDDAYQVAVVLDCSGSMQAVDGDAPPEAGEEWRRLTRLSHGKECIRKLVKSLEGKGRVSLTAFAGQVVSAVPLTPNKDLFFKRLEQLDSDVLSDGSALGNALAVALRTLGRSSKGCILLVSDGVDHSPDGGRSALEVAAEAGRAGVMLVCLGIGEARPGFHQTGAGRWERVGEPVDRAMLEALVRANGGMAVGDAAGMEAAWQRIQPMAGGDGGMPVPVEAVLCLAGMACLWGVDYSRLL